MDEEFIRNRITELRLKKGVSEYQMSMELGQNRSYIQAISSGRSMPSMKPVSYTHLDHTGQGEGASAFCVIPRGQLIQQEKEYPAELDIPAAQTSAVCCQCSCQWNTKAEQGTYQGLSLIHI